MLWKFIDNPREDSLTAAIFGHLLHLPNEIFWQILKDACSSCDFPEHPGELLSVHGWPNWNAAGTTNTNRVIPDLIIEFKDFDLIIEAKRWDSPMQNINQWYNQFIAYTNEYGMKREVKMLAIGGIHSHQSESLTHPHWKIEDESECDSNGFTCRVYMCQWSSLLLACQRLRRQLRTKDHTCSRNAADIRILSDLIGFFVRHGFKPIRWFPDFNFETHLLDDGVDSYQQILRKRMNTFQTL